MEVTAAGSPVYRAPWRPWRIRMIGTGSEAGASGRLDLRVGYCRGPAVRDDAAAFARLVERERRGDRVATKGDLRSSLVPVVLVDGVPVATGWGAVKVPLRPGRRLVEIQSQHSRAWRAVDIRAGKPTRLDYVGLLGDQHLSYATGRVRGVFAHFSGYTLGPRGRLDLWQYLPDNARRRRSANLWMVGLFAAVFGLPLISALHLPIPESAQIPLAIAWLCGTLVAATVFWLGRVLWTAVRYNRLSPEAPLDVEGRPGTHPVRVLDPFGSPPEPAPGMAALLIDARFLKTDLESEDLARQLPDDRPTVGARHRRRLDHIGELAPLRHRVAIPAPEILLDGTPVRASWTRMWIEVVPGQHTLQARCPASPLPVRGGRETAEEQRIDLALVPDRTTAVDLTVAVTAVPDPLQPVLYAWEGRMRHFGEGRSEPQWGPPPRLDVRGELKAMLTELNPLTRREGPHWNRPGAPGSRYR